MTKPNPDRITGTIAFTVLPEAGGQYLCQMSPMLSDQVRSKREFSGQTPEHAIAIALEQLADEYRTLAESCQNLDWDLERSSSGSAIEKPYHVILHYEQILEAESKFEAMHHTIMGNTVVENAKMTVIEISPALTIRPLAKEV